MLSIYWPGKTIPAWLEDVRFSGESNGVPVVQHKGIGVIANRGGSYFAWGIAGTFIYINGAGMSVTVRGQGKGVKYFPSFSAWVRAILGKEGEA